MTNDDIYNGLIEQIKQQPLLPNGTRELFCVQQQFNPVEQLSIAKQSYCNAELEWYRQQSLNINTQPLIGRNPIWNKAAASDGSVNSNYGWCIWSKENYEQYKYALDTLLKDLYTRQSVCTYIRPEICRIWNDGIHANYDFICTFCTHHFIRNNKLEYIVYMRSNDARYGLPYDLVWHQFVYNQLLNDINEAGDRTDNQLLKDVMPGWIWWHASSLHLYEGR